MLVTETKQSQLYHMFGTHPFTYKRADLIKTFTIKVMVRIINNK